jgi:magnesium transporter
MDFYDDYLFVVVHSINLKTLEADEVDLFVSDNFVVT